jgi:hypothetical protein
MDLIFVDPMTFLIQTARSIMENEWKKLRLYELVQKLRGLDQITQGELKQLDGLFPRVMAAGEPSRALTIEEIMQVIGMAERYFVPHPRGAGLNEIYAPEGRK